MTGRYRLLAKARLVVLSLFLLLLPCVAATAGGKGGVLPVQVFDAEKHAPLPGVILTAGSRHAVTDREGRATLDETALSDGTVVSFALIGYETAFRTLESLRSAPEVLLSPTVISLEGISVEAERPLPSLSAVGERLDDRELALKGSESLAEALSGVKGISRISSGTASSVPVIQGMSGNRILTVVNGVRQEGQQWNVELGPDVDAAAAGSVTVLKGAESVRHGSNALGGVILVDEAPLPFGGKAIGIDRELFFATNGLTWGGRLMLEGAFGKGKAYGYRFQGSYASGGDRSTAKYVLNNTGLRDYSLHATLGMKKARYGLALRYELLYHEEGIMYEAKMGNAEELKARIERGRPLVILPASRKIDFPKHTGLHTFLKAEGYLYTGDEGKLALNLAYQRDVQKEYHYRRMLRSDIPSVALTLDNLQGDLSWSKSFGGQWSAEAGLGGMYTRNTNTPGTGVVPLIPNYVEALGGLYLIGKYHGERFGAEAGVRGDLDYLNALGIDAYSQTYGGERSFRNLTYTVGGHLHLTPRLSLVTNFGTAWRAPHVAELWSNGLDATGSLYLRGDDAIRSERSTKWVASLAYEGETLSAGLEGYLTWIDGYIYKEPAQETFAVISGTYPLFRYRQTGAYIHGADAEVSLRITPFLRYKALAGMILAAESSTGRYLPYIPPFRLSQTLSLSLPLLSESFIEAGHRYVAEQKRFDPATDLIPFAPPAYHLFSLRLGASQELGKWGRLSLMISVENLLNLEYKEYTNLARYYAHEAGRDLRISLRYEY